MKKYIFSRESCIGEMTNGPSGRGAKVKRSNPDPEPIKITQAQPSFSSMRRQIHGNDTAVIQCLLQVDGGSTSTSFVPIRNEGNRKPMKMQ